MLPTACQHPLCPTLPTNLPHHHPCRLAAARATPALLSTVRALASAAEPALATPQMDNAMFCYQCEQTKNGTGCTTKGARVRERAAHVCWAAWAEPAAPCADPSQLLALCQACSVSGHFPCTSHASPAQPGHLPPAPRPAHNPTLPHPSPSAGVCGKTPETTVLQDLLTYSLKGLSCWAHWAKQQGVEVPQDVYK